MPMSNAPTGRRMAHRWEHRAEVAAPPARIADGTRSLLVAVDDSAAVEVVRAELHLHPVAQHDADAVPAHASGGIPEGFVPVVEGAPEHAVPERLQDFP